MSDYESLRKKIRAMTRGTYDLQKMRIMLGLRVCANFKAELGNIAGETEDEMPDEAQNILKDLRKDYVLLCTGVARNRTLPSREGFRGTALIPDYTSLVLASHYFGMLEVEERHFRQLGTELEEVQVYREYLSKQVGVGPAMAAVLISELDCAKFANVSKVWTYSGLDVGPDGAGRSARKEHLVDREYLDKDGVVQTKKSITYNPFLKAKLVGVLAACFLRSNSPWRAQYDNYKHRCQSDPRKKEWTKGHIHNASKRYMIKMFLADYWDKARKLEGLDTRPMYHEGVLGRIHGGQMAAE